MEMLVQDLRYAFRTLLGAPGFCFVVIISIALGFAANATVFSVANGLLWGVLPVKDPGRMVMFSEGESFSYPDYIDYRDQTARHLRWRSRGALSAHSGEHRRQGRAGARVGTVGQRKFLSRARCADGAGRPILPEDDRTTGSNHVAVLSNSLWRRRFAGDPNILNRDIALNGQHYAVVGIAPAGFYGVDRGIASEFWVPLATAEEIMPDLISEGSMRNKRDNQWLMLDARLKPGVSRSRAAVLVNVVKKRHRRYVSQRSKAARKRDPANRGRAHRRFRHAGIHAHGGPDGRGRTGAAGGLRQCCQPAAGARRRTAKRNRHSPRHGSGPPSTHPATADRKPPAGAGRRRRRVPAGRRSGARHLQFPAPAAVPGGLRLQCRSARGALHPGLVRGHGPAVRTGSRAARVAA